MPPRIPIEADFARLAPQLQTALHFPSPREATTSLLVLFHGLGDHEAPFASFARSLALPGVLAIAVRGVAPLPPGLAPPGTDRPHAHWGDDLALDPSTGELEVDSGFEAAADLVMRLLVRETLLERCGWEASDVMLFGFGQGGSLALGLTLRLMLGPRVIEDVSGGEQDEEEARRRQARAEGTASFFKGVVSIGGPLPPSMVPSGLGAAREKSETSVLVCQLSDEQAGAVRRQFKDVTAVRWRRSEVAMPRDREEALPIIKFFARCLNKGWETG